jgi:hypothetical protein
LDIQRLEGDWSVKCTAVDLAYYETKKGNERVSKTDYTYYVTKKSLSNEEYYAAIGILG